MADVYRDNPNLKRAYVAQEWSEEEVQEYVKCSQDIEYFIMKYVKIVSLDHGLIPFDLYEKQKNMVSTIDKNRFSIIKTCRQAGKTTTTAAVILWHALFNSEYTVAILANKLSTAREILSRVQRAFEYLPKWLQQGIVSWNKTNVEFENGSVIIASSTASSAIRGYSINFLYLDEFAFVPRNIQDDFFTSVYPTIIAGTKTKIVITSTPNGFDLFYKIWIDSVEERNEYANFEMFWWDVPGRDEEWKRKTISNTSEEQFRQEFEAEFIGSSDSLISPKTLRTLAFINPVEEFYEGALRIYENPVKGHSYFIVVDTSRGQHLDSSAFTVIDTTEVPYKVVACYSSNTIAPLLYPDIIYESAKAYNEAFVLVEINDNGQQVADILHDDLEYENVIFTSMKGRSGQVIGGGFAATTQKGVRTTKQVKRIGCANMKSMIESEKIMLHDFTLINELTTFCLKGSSYEAGPGAHDDHVMCLVLFSWATNQPFFKDITNTDFRERLRADRDLLIDESVMPFGILDDGHEEEDTVVVYEPWDGSDQDWFTS